MTDQQRFREAAATMRLMAEETKASALTINIQDCFTRVAEVLEWAAGEQNDFGEVLQRLAATQTKLKQ